MLTEKGVVRMEECRELLKNVPMPIDSENVKLITGKQLLALEDFLMLQRIENRESILNFGEQITLMHKEIEFRLDCYDRNPG